MTTDDTYSDPMPWISLLTNTRMPYHPGFGAAHIVFRPRNETPSEQSSAPEDES